MYDYKKNVNKHVKRGYFVDFFCIVETRCWAVNLLDCEARHQNESEICQFRRNAVTSKNEFGWLIRFNLNIVL